MDIYNPCSLLSWPKSDTETKHRGSEKKMKGEIIPWLICAWHLGSRGLSMRELL